MPQQSVDAMTLSRRDLSACRRLLANGSKTFFAASFLLPRRVREPATALYAFCRVADDAVDHGGGTSDVLDALNRRLDSAYSGTPLDLAPDRALAAVVSRHAIPIELPRALIEGFAWDQQGCRYETIGDLEGYAARVAGTVGAMMAILMGVRDEAMLARACDLGIAMQLTNIARDVGEDARAGRLYLPMSWMREAGLDPEAFLATPRHSGALAAVIERLLTCAEQLYRRSESGIAALPADCRHGIAAARFLYAEIGNELIRQGLDSVNRRAVVSPARKLQLLARAARRTGLSRTQLRAPAVGSARYLVAAGSSATASPAQESRALIPQWWNLPARFMRVIEIFERLERRDRDSTVKPTMLLQLESGAPAGN
jgi:phytoene synthase